MIQISPKSAGKVLGARFVGKISDSDLSGFLKAAEAVIDKQGGLRLLVDASAFDGWAWHAAYDKTAFGIRHWADIEKMAIITDTRWHALSAAIADKLMHAEVRDFGTDAVDDAWDWVRA